MKIVFMGTPDFSAITLERLNAVYPVSAVVTSPDKPVGRKYGLQPSPLKEKAISLGIPVYQYDKVSREGIDDIISLAPDLVVTAAFGQILSERFLSIPKYGVLNVHASLLPKYRGASPIQHAILDGEEETGITIMRTVKAVDAGDILLQKRTRIGEEETASELFDRLAKLGGEAIVEAVTLLESGKAEFIPQDESLATHCSMISKADGKIDFSKTAKQLDCFVRGMTSWPSAYTQLDGKMLKVFKLEKIENISEIENQTYKNGVVVAADKRQGLVVAVGGNEYVRLKELQLEGSKRMTDIEFLRGRPVELGTRLG